MSWKDKKKKAWKKVNEGVKEMVQVLKCMQLNLFQYQSCFWSLSTARTHPLVKSQESKYFPMRFCFPPSDTGEKLSLPKSHKIDCQSKWKFSKKSFNEQGNVDHDYMFTNTINMMMVMLMHKKFME